MLYAVTNTAKLKNCKNQYQEGISLPVQSAQFSVICTIEFPKHVEGLTFV
jgi:hypothetical protein